MAFTSQSSYGTLPVTIESLVNRVGVSENIASFVAPLGSTIGMNGCGGLYPAIVAIFVANVFNIELTMYSYILIILTTIIINPLSQLRTLCLTSIEIQIHLVDPLSTFQMMIYHSNN